MVFFDICFCLLPPVISLLYVLDIIIHTENFSLLKHNVLKRQVLGMS